MPNLSQDFHNLLLSEEYSDVTFKVKDRQFCAHKLVLASRSAVFSTMFRHSKRKTSSCTETIEDCKPSAFQDFLTFVYSGRIDKLSSKNVVDLFSLADKYDVRDLKGMCLNFMKRNLNLDTVCDVVAIADRHNEKKLKKSASDLIRNNLKTLIPTNRWISFMADRPSLASEILMKAIPDTREIVYH